MKYIIIMSLLCLFGITQPDQYLWHTPQYAAIQIPSYQQHGVECGYCALFNTYAIRTLINQQTSITAPKIQNLTQQYVQKYAQQNKALSIGNMAELIKKLDLAIPNTYFLTTGAQYNGNTSYLTEIENTGLYAAGVSAGTNSTHSIDKLSKLIATTIQSNSASVISFIIQSGWHWVSITMHKKPNKQVMIWYQDSQNNPVRYNKKITTFMKRLVTILENVLCVPSINTQHTYTIHGTSLVIANDDITAYTGDAIVNPANTQLHHHGTLARAISDAAGPKFQKASDALPRVNGQRCPTGTVVMTDAFNLPTKKVIHAVGPRITFLKLNNFMIKKPWGPTKDDAALLAATYTNVLACAQKNGIKTIAIPSISTGAFGYPIKQACPIALNAITAYLKTHKNAFKEIRLIFWDKSNDLSIYKTQLDQYAHDASMTGIHAWPATSSRISYYLHKHPKRCAVGISSAVVGGLLGYYWYKKEQKTK